MKRYSKFIGIFISVVLLGLVGIVCMSQSVNINTGSHVININTDSSDIVIDKPDQVILINSSCKQLVVTKNAKNCLIKIDASVTNDVHIDGDGCRIELLKGAQFGTKTTRWQWWPFSVNISNQGSRFYINGNNCIICALQEQPKTINAQFFVIGNSANVLVSIGGSAYLRGDNIVLEGTGGLVEIVGNNGTIRNAIGGSATIRGNNCTLHGPIGGSAHVDGNGCKIYGPVGGSIKVQGEKCFLYGPVGGSAIVKKDTIMVGSIGGRRTVTK